jgi:AraC-like DNA-binding protein
MSYWDFWSVISVAGILQAGLLVVNILLNRRSHHVSGIFIVALLFWIIWLQLEFLALRRSFLVANGVFFGTRHGAWLAMGPLVYHYLLSRFGKLKAINFRTILHYAPFLAFTMAIPVVIGETIPDRVISYGMLSVLKFPMLAGSWINTAYGYVFIFQFFHAAFYLCLSVALIIGFQKEAMSRSSDNRQNTLTVLKSIVIATMFFTVAAIFFIAVLLKSQWYVREMDYLYIVPMTLCVYVMSYFARSSPGPEGKDTPPVRYLQSKLEKAASAKYFEHVTRIINDKKLYLNPELRLSDLVEESGIGYHQLSEVINREAGVSFFEFINDFRITEVTNTLEDLHRQNKKINILEIAFASGFNNKVSFNKHFKKMKGRTPTAFIKETLKKE